MNSVFWIFCVHLLIGSAFLAEWEKPTLNMEFFQAEKSEISMNFQKPKALERRIIMGRKPKKPSGEPQKEGLLVGIDFGTTYSKAARLDEAGKAEVIRSNGKDLQVPSAIFFHKNGREEYGLRAQNYQLVDPSCYFVEFKRLLGQVGVDGKPPTIFIHPQTQEEITPVDITSKFLAYFKKTIEAELQVQISAAVITCPAYYQDAQIRQTREAAEMAGLTVLRIVQEPVAAAMSSKAERPIEGNILVYDLGGGTFDSTLVEFQGDALRVLATDGDSKLGGCDFDMALMETVLAAFKKQHGYTPDPVEDAQDIQDLRSRVTQARHDLSESESTTIMVRIGKHTSDWELARAEFEQMVQGTVDKTVEISKRCLATANLSQKELKNVLLVGGATHMPCVKKALEKAFGDKVLATRDREFCVAKGAALQAVYSARESENLALSEPAWLLPAPEMTVTTKTSHHLSVAVADKSDPTGERLVNHVMIPAQTDLPCSRTDRFAPVEDNVPHVVIKVTQGEEEAPVNTNDVVSIVQLSLKPLPVAQRRQSIEITYSFDVDGIIRVHAKDLIGGAEVDGEVGMSSALQEVRI